MTAQKKDPEDKRVFLTPEAAIAIMADGEYVHTFLSGGNGMVGADWPRAKLEQAIRESPERQLSGKIAMSMGHGFSIPAKGNSRLFVATKRSAADV